MLIGLLDVVDDPVRIRWDGLGFRAFCIYDGISSIWDSFGFVLRISRTLCSIVLICLACCMRGLSILYRILLIILLLILFSFLVLSFSNYYLLLIHSFLCGLLSYSLFEQKAKINHFLLMSLINCMNMYQECCNKLYISLGFLFCRLLS